MPPNIEPNTVHHYMQGCRYSAKQRNVTIPCEMNMQNYDYGYSANSKMKPLLSKRHLMIINQ